MTNRSVVHATFCIDRTYDAAPARVFRAFADPVAKAAWFAGPDGWEKQESAFDFRVGGRERLVGGRERLVGGPKGQPPHAFDCVYQEIIPGERIIYSYEMHLGGTRISVSLATIELKSAGAGTRLIFTEQGAFLDGYDDAGSREAGTRDLLENLGAYLAKLSLDA